MFYFLTAAESREADLHWGTTTPLLICESCVICGWPVIIWSTSESFTQVVSHVNFTQEMTSAFKICSKLSRVCKTSVIFSPAARTLPALIYCYARSQGRHPGAVSSLYNLTAPSPAQLLFLSTSLSTCSVTNARDQRCEIIMWDQI